MTEQVSGYQRQQLTRELAAPILQNVDVGSLGYREIARLFKDDAEIFAAPPEGIYQVDPRSGERVLFSSARAGRPHDAPPEKRDVGGEKERLSCAICRGQTTGLIDLHDLSEGFTFINKNLFPILLPPEEGEPLPEVNPDHPPPDHKGMPARGLHLLQWTSSIHENDWHSMPVGDLAKVMQRLAVLERQLLTTNHVMPSTRPWTNRSGISGFVSIIKNGGRLAGGSITHGHQQIAFSNVMPRSKYQHWAYAQKNAEPFSAYLLRDNPGQLTIRDYGPALLIVPYFMRRPYDMMLLLRDTGKMQLFDLDSDEILAISEGWHDALRALHDLMPSTGREIAYNVITHSGPGAGLYFSFLPYTQETGGFEQLGLSVCQATPAEVTKSLKSRIHR